MSDTREDLLVELADAEDSVNVLLVQQKFAVLDQQSK